VKESKDEIHEQDIVPIKRRRGGDAERLITIFRWRYKVSITASLKAIWAPQECEMKIIVAMEACGSYGKEGSIMELGVRQQRDVTAKSMNPLALCIPASEDLQQAKGN
jgi:hypothetical protein